MKCVLYLVTDKIIFCFINIPNQIYYNQSKIKKNDMLYLYYFQYCYIILTTIIDYKHYL